MRRLVELRNIPPRFSGGPLGTVFMGRRGEEVREKGGGIGENERGRDWEEGEGIGGRRAGWMGKGGWGEGER